MSSSVSSSYLRPSISGRFHSAVMMARLAPSVLRKQQRERSSIRNDQHSKSIDDPDDAVVVGNSELEEELDVQSSHDPIEPDNCETSTKTDKRKPVSGRNEQTTESAPCHEESAATSASSKRAGQSSLQSVEFSFLDNKNVCCGLCGEIVPYELLMNEHLPTNHPDVFSSKGTLGGAVSAEQELQQRRLKEKLSREKRLIETGFKMAAYRSAARVSNVSMAKRRLRNNDEPSRRVSAIRVNPRLMSLAELEEALRKKMFEKLNRRVPVTLMDKMHARCGICNAIISLNKKFEIVHLVRHFNCWHPTVHACAGSWANRQSKRRGVKLLSVRDFAVVDTGSGSPDSLQCIWCGMFVESQSLAQHFGELHADEVEVPKCNLCMQEMILTARFQEKFNIEIEITLPDEHHMKCSLCGADFTNELRLETHIQRRHVEGLSVAEDPLGDSDSINLEEIGPEAFSNSRMILGKRRRPKRQFIMPALRQAVPLDSRYVEPIAECHWKCKLCEGDIYGAVISAAAIRHYKDRHPQQVDNMQYEICKSRLDKVSDSCMEFVHPQLIECLLCQQSINLHQPFNMCRAIRHLKAKHPNLMPEYAGLSHLEEADAGEDGMSIHVSSAVVSGTITATATATVTATPLSATFDQQNMIEGAEGTADAGACETEGMEGTSDGFVVGAGGEADSVPYATSTPAWGSMSGAVRVIRTSNPVRYSDHDNYQSTVPTSIAAKNARLDHGALMRQASSRMDVLEEQSLETPAPLLFQHQPRRYYLLLQTSAEDTLASAHQHLLDSPMVGGPMQDDRRSMLSAGDDSLIEEQRLAELMAQAKSAMAASSTPVDHNQPQSIMAGDDPLG